MTAGHCDKFWTIERPVGEGNQKDEKLGRGGIRKIYLQTSKGRVIRKIY